jgi:hypothetical protein
MRNGSTNDRDRALQRLRRSTSIVLAGAGALVVAFAGLAARALPGRHTVKVSHAHVQTTQRNATPPPLVPAQSAATPTAPAAPPAQSPAPPVVVSGGT